MKYNTLLIFSLLAVIAVLYVNSSSNIEGFQFYGDSTYNGLVWAAIVVAIIGIISITMYSTL